MSNIDDRIILMRFDNSQFERRLSETVKSLDGLNKTINNMSKTTALTGLEKSARNIDFKPAKNSAADLMNQLKGFRLNTMVEQVQGVSKSFMAMSTVAMTVLSRITSGAMTAGINIAKSLSLAPLKDGLSEYETNMNSIQTILSNTKHKGATLEDVNDALDKLNEYSDKTIYNFAQMAKNIGTFTAAGVDLDTSVGAIKGVANLSAMSGASAEDASRAMYQLSQAISSGRMTLMDWNSMVNANIGGEVFKKTLFETGKALGTIKNANLGTTFEEWEKAGGKFREQMSSEWITGEVLTTALNTFTGDLSEAEFKSLGYTDAQTKALMEQAKTAVAAATEVKTFTQLMGTLKEAMGTGWATSFRLIFGHFEEAKKMWTGAYNYLNGIIGRSADRRNELLLSWKEMGGRDSMIKGVQNLAKSLEAIFGTIAKAFREVFPAMTAERLMYLTMRFEQWAKQLKPSAEGLTKLSHIFKGFFTAIKLGFAIIKRFVGMFGDLWSSAKGGEKSVGFLERLASFFINFEKNAMGPMGSINQFFERLTYWIKNPQEALLTLGGLIKDFFDKISSAKGVSEVLGSIGERFGWLKPIVLVIGNVVNWVLSLFQNIPKALGAVFGAIRSFFTSFGRNLSNAIRDSPVSAETAGKTIGVGLLAGILLQLRKITKEGLPKEFNVIKDIFKNVNKTLESLTGTLEAMQTKLKASALKDIAIAVGILALAVLVLASINPDDLTKAFIALGVGLGQLVGAMRVLGMFTNTKSLYKVLILATAIGILSMALILTGYAVRKMGSMDLKTIGRGLLGIAGALTILTGFMKLIQGSTRGVLRTGAALILISISLLILYKAIEKFGTLDWGVLKQGLMGIAGGLLVIAAAMWAMPPGMLSQSVALIGIAIALNILRFAVESFGNIDIEVLRQGLLGVAAALVVVVAAAWLLPRDLLITAGGLLVFAIALNILALAVASFGGLSQGTLIQGVLGLAAALIVVGTAAHFMGTPQVFLGAIAIAILSAALIGIAYAIDMLAKIPIAQIAIAIGGFAGFLLMLGGVAYILTPAIPSMLSLAGALFLIGLGLAAFGFGVKLLGEGLMLMVKAGPKAFSQFLAAVRKFLTMLPSLVADFFKSVKAALDGFVLVLPSLLKIVDLVILGVLDILVKAVPKIVVLLGRILDGLMTLAVTRGPEFIRTILFLFDTLLVELRAKAPSIVENLVGILIGIFDALATNAGRLTDSLGNLFVSVIEGITNQVDPIVTALVDFLVAVLESVADKIDDVVDAMVGVWLAVFEAIGDAAKDLVDGFVGMLVKVIEAIGGGITKLVDAFIDVIVEMIEKTAERTTQISKAVTKLIDAIGRALKQAAKDAVELLAAGREAIETFADGMEKNNPAIARAAARIVRSLVGSFGIFISELTRPGREAVGKFVGGIISRIATVTKPASDLIGKVISGIASGLSSIFAFGVNIVANLIAGVQSIWNTLTSIGGDIVGGIRRGISDAWNGFIDWLWGKLGGLPGVIKDFFGINSPSRLMMEYGRYIGEGLVIGTKNGLEPMGKTLTQMSASAIDAFGHDTRLALIDAQKKLAMGFDGLGITNPVIRPELDLAGVALEARRLGDILDYATIDTSAAFGQATEIASVNMRTMEPAQAGPVESVIHMEQNNYSPIALPAKYIFRKTKSAVAKAKAELEIP